MRRSISGTVQDERGPGGAGEEEVNEEELRAEKKRRAREMKKARARQQQVSPSRRMTPPGHKRHPNLTLTATAAVIFALAFVLTFSFALPPIAR